MLKKRTVIFGHEGYSKAFDLIGSTEEKIHLTHCNRGEFPSSCKYGDKKNCLALKKASLKTKMNKEFGSK